MEDPGGKREGLEKRVNLRFALTLTRRIWRYRFNPGPIGFVRQWSGE